MSEETIELGDRTVTVRETDDGSVEATERDSLVSYLEGHHPDYCTEYLESPNGTKFNDCDVAILRRDRDYINQHYMKALSDDPNIAVSWVGMTDDGLQVGIYDAR